jgi:hypothetical protein
MTLNLKLGESAPILISIDHTAAVTYGGKLFLVGGFLEYKNPTDKLLIYDTDTNK